jgi:hypothetical protein
VALRKACPSCPHTLPLAGEAAVKLPEAQSHWCLHGAAVLPVAVPVAVVQERCCCSSGRTLRSHEPSGNSARTELAQHIKQPSKSGTAHVPCLGNDRRRSVWPWCRQLGAWRRHAMQTGEIHLHRCRRTFNCSDLAVQGGRRG